MDVSYPTAAIGTAAAPIPKFTTDAGILARVKLLQKARRLGRGAATFVAELRAQALKKKQLAKSLIKV